MKSTQDQIVKDYFESLYEVGRHGDAREESFYNSLQTLLEAAAASLKAPHIQVTILPKKTEAGNPDFRVWDGRSKIVGYVEAKTPGTNLDHAQTSDQLKRYLHTFPNVILTDFYEFRFYRDGQRLIRSVAGQSFVPGTLKCPSPVKDAEALFQLLEKFFAFSLPKTLTAKSLAIELAKRTRFLRDEVIALELKEQTEAGSGDILGFYKAFHDFLIAGLSHEQFADLYSQTITYGMFAARTRTNGDFTRRVAYDRIPRTVGILRDIFQFISLGDIREPLKWMVDDIAEVLAATDVKNILNRFFRERKGRDPIVHFYETFLAEYDPKERERRGVYYTPEPVVGYIVRSIHHLLKEKFDKADGLASEGVTLLDPAAGTMTFVAEAARIASEEYESKYGNGAKAEFIHDNILENFYGFELMMAPYAVGHLKMSFMLEEFGYVLKDDDRLKLYLTNTLEFEDLEQTDLPCMRSLSEESRMAGKVKKEQPILVILGNPPYSGHSFNMGKWIRGLINDYKKVDGKPLGEKNPKWLQDDYVKFLRFAQWKIEQAGEGIVGMITNHGYLDNPTFRGMRQSLTQTFDEIYVVDLHGNSLKREICPDGSKDENVFDIRPGVAIVLMVKGVKRKAVRQTDIYGLRQKKYDWLDSHDVKTTKWQTLKPHSPLYLFVPRDEAAAKCYESFVSMPTLFPVNSVGIVTSRDHFVIDFDKTVLKRRIDTFRNEQFSDELVAKMLSLTESKAWEIKDARCALGQDKDWEKHIVGILYRPFDIRHFCYHPALIERERQEVMQHMMQDNLCLSTCRQTVQENWHHALCGAHIVESSCVSNMTREIGYVFPLYLYPEPPQKSVRSRAVTMMLFEPGVSYGSKRANINPDVFQALKAAMSRNISPEDVFHYVYAVLYSPSYREKYAEFLKSDFPRIPFTSDHDIFCSIARVGKQLVELHLLRSKKLNKPIVRFYVKGDNLVAKNNTAGRRYDPEKQRVYINREQYFGRISEDLWTYRIGGYQVLDKWLKDRVERRLSATDIKHYCRVATALSETMKLQKELADLYPKVEKKLIAK